MDSYNLPTPESARKTAMSSSQAGRLLKELGSSESKVHEGACSRIRDFSKNPNYFMTIFTSSVHQSDQKVKSIVLKILPDLLSLHWTNVPVMRKTMKNLLLLTKDKSLVIRSESISMIDKCKALCPSFAEIAANEKGLKKFLDEMPIELYNLDWKIRLTAVQSIVAAMDNTPKDAKFTRIATKVLTDTNSSVKQLGFTLLDHLLETNFLPSEALINICLEQLADSKVGIRHAAFKSFKRLVLLSNPSLLFPKLIESTRSENWILRNEAIHVIIMAMIVAPSAYDYFQMIPDLAKCLDDPKSKIRHISAEALHMIAFAHGSGKVLKVLGPLVDENALQLLSEGFNSREIPVIKDKFVEFPRREKRVQTAYTARNNQKDCNVASYPALPSIRTDTSFSRKRLNTSQSVPMLKQEKQEKQEVEKVLYIAYEDLQPPESKGFDASILDKKEWSEWFESLNLLRRYAKHCSGSLTGHLKQIIKFSVVQADSLRSNLSKNSLIFIKELSEALKQSLDKYASDLIRILMKRSSDSNSFISSEATKALTAVVSNLSPLRVLLSLLKHCANSKNAVIRGNVCLSFQILIENEDALKLKEMGTVVRGLSMYISDSSQEVRNKSRAALQSFNKIAPAQLEELIKAEVKADAAIKIQDILNGEYSRYPSRKSTLPSFRQSNTNRKTVLSKASANISALDFKTRMSAITQIEKMVDQISPNNASIVKDILKRSFEDGNLKIVMAALNLLRGIAHLDEIKDLKEKLPLNSPHDCVVKLAKECLEIM